MSLSDKIYKLARDVGIYEEIALQIRTFIEYIFQVGLPESRKQELYLQYYKMLRENIQGIITEQHKIELKNGTILIFDYLLNSGTYGDVFTGTAISSLEDGTIVEAPVAIKRFNIKSSIEKEIFISELMNSIYIQISVPFIIPSMLAVTFAQDDKSGEIIPLIAYEKMTDTFNHLIQDLLEYPIEILALIKQVLNIILLFVTMHFKHRDMKPDNIMYINVDTTTKIAYNIAHMGISGEIPTYGKLIKIIDYGFSCLTGKYGKSHELRSTSGFMETASKTDCERNQGSDMSFFAYNIIKHTNITTKPKLRPIIDVLYEMCKVMHNGYLYSFDEQVRLKTEEIYVLHQDGISMYSPGVIFRMLLSVRV